MTKIIDSFEYSARYAAFTGEGKHSIIARQRSMKKAQGPSM
jgi:hypothetical protein